MDGAGRVIGRSGRLTGAAGVAVLAAMLAVTSVGGVASAQPGDWNSSFGDCGAISTELSDPVGLAVNGNRTQMAHVGSTRSPETAATAQGRIVRVNPTTGATVAVAQLAVRYPADWSPAPSGVTKTGFVVGRQSLTGAREVYASDDASTSAAASFRLDLDADPATGAVADRVFTTPTVNSDQPDFMVVGQILDQFGNHQSTSVSGWRGSGSTPMWSIGDAAVTGLTGTVAAMQPDGKLVVAGRPAGGGDTLDAFAVYRFTMTGQIDTGFPVTAHLAASATGLVDPAVLRQVLVQPDGAIVVGGELVHGAGYLRDLGFTRLLADGAVDTSFGTGGTTRIDAGDFDGLRGLTRLDDGRLVAVGTSVQPLSATSRPYPLLLVATMSSDGVPDHSMSVEYDLGRGINVSGAATTSGRTFAVLGSIIGELDSFVISIRTDATAAGTGYVLDGYGDLYGFRPKSAPPAACVLDTPYWDGWNIARGVAVARNQGGYELDGFGGLHPFAIDTLPAPGATRNGPYWSGWDIARGVALRPNGKGGYVIDGWGGVHPFAVGANAMPPKVSGTAYWQGWDIVRGIAVLPNGSGGYTLDGYGGLHAFRTGSNPMPPAVNGNSYWSGWDIARGVSILPDGTGGYVVDGFGGLHPFGIGGHAPPALPVGAPYWGHDLAHGVALVLTSSMTAAATRGGGWPVVRAELSRSR